jgi:hypothetical protein
MEFPLARDEDNLAADRKFREALGLAAGHGPSYFQSRDFGAFSGAEGCA